MPPPAPLATRSMRLKSSLLPDAATRSSSSTRTDLPPRSPKLLLLDPELVEEPGLVEGRPLQESPPLPPDMIGVTLEKRLRERTSCAEVARELCRSGALGERKDPGVLGPAVLPRPGSGLASHKTDAGVAD